MATSSVPPHRSVRALLSEATKGESAEDVIRRKCRAYVAHAKAKGWGGPIFNPWHLASFLGLHAEETTDDFPGDGRLFPRGEQVVIQYRAGQLIERQRFTICHEIAHTCFPDAYEFVRHFESRTNEEKAFLEFENLCNIGAAELLFPIDEFQVDLALDTLRLGHCSFLAGRYGASIDATIKRVLDLTSHSCAALFVTDTGFDGFAAIDGRWRVKYCWKSQAFRGYFPKGMLLPKSTGASLANCASTKDLRSARETWWINSRPRSFYVEALPLPRVENKEYARALVLVHSKLP